LYKRYAELRDKKGVTDYKVSKETGISKSSFSEWKSGRSKPKAEKLKKIADYFGVTIEYFLE
jgi:transcriptional regulator with XRE-family HTH domain